MAQKISSLNLEVLRKFSLFASLSDDQLEEVAGAAPKISVAAGADVFRQGDHPTAVYLILKGGVKIEHQDEDGESFVVGELSENHTFGELAILSEEPRRVTVTAILDSDFLLIDRWLMLDLIRRSDAEQILGLFSLLNEQILVANNLEIQHVLSSKTKAAQIEAERQRTLTQMAAGVAHEINTPLGIINTAVSIMARELAEPKEITIQRAADIAESLELIRRNVDRADQLIQDFKKVSVSQLTSEKENLDISEVVEDTINLVNLSLKKNKISVKLHDNLKADQREWVGYRGLLSQILINFLTNVERYAYPHGAGGIVDIDLELEGDCYQIIVRDHGRGISQENMSHIFEPFFTTGRAKGGTGLGLAIAHDLVTNALKGDISVNSKPGEGTEFTVRFPKVVPE